MRRLLPNKTSLKPAKLLIFSDLKVLVFSPGTIYMAQAGDLYMDFGAWSADRLGGNNTFSISDFKTAAYTMLAKRFIFLLIE